MPQGPRRDQYPLKRFLKTKTNLAYCNTREGLVGLSVRWPGSDHRVRQTRSSGQNRNAGKTGVRILFFQLVARHIQRDASQAAARGLPERRLSKKLILAAPSPPQHSEPLVSASDAGVWTKGGGKEKSCHSAVVCCPCLCLSVWFFIFRGDFCAVGM